MLHESLKVGDTVITIKNSVIGGQWHGEGLIGVISDYNEEYLEFMVKFVIGGETLFGEWPIEIIDDFLELADKRPKPKKKHKLTNIFI